MTNDERRDMFAAAALAGLLCETRNVSPVIEDEYAKLAYRLADAMLRERAATNHNAAPAAKAQVDAAGISRQGTGDTTREPVAWLVLDATLEPFSVHRQKTAAVNDANDVFGFIFPLYRDPPPPALTDAERSVLREVRDDYAFRRNEHCQRVASVLDGLLARLGGDK